MYKKLFYGLLFIITIILLVLLIGINLLKNQINALILENDKLIYEYEVLPSILKYLELLPGELKTIGEVDDKWLRDFKKSETNHNLEKFHNDLKKNTRIESMQNGLMSTGYIEVKYKQEVDYRLIYCTYLYKINGFRDI